MSIRIRSRSVVDLITPKIKKTIVNVISKSGETAETASQFILFRDLLQQKLGKKYKENILATTDPKGGTLAGDLQRGRLSHAGST